MAYFRKRYTDCGVKIRYGYNSNLCYGPSHNFAMQQSIEDGCDYQFFLSSEIYFDSGVLSELIRYMDSNSNNGNVVK